MINEILFNLLERIAVAVERMAAAMERSQANEQNYLAVMEGMQQSAAAINERMERLERRDMQGWS
mgnify:CR=1 FL=1